EVRLVVSTNIAPLTLTLSPEGRGDRFGVDLARWALSGLEVPPPNLPLAGGGAAAVGRRDRALCRPSSLFRIVGTGKNPRRLGSIVSLPLEGRDQGWGCRGSSASRG